MAEESDPGVARVVIGEAHVVVRRGFVTLLGQEKGFGVVGEAGDGWSAVEVTMRLEPDVVLLNVDLPRLNGFDAARHIKRSLPRTKVILLSLRPPVDDISLVMQAGVDGYLPPNSTVDHMYSTIRALHTGGNRLVSTARNSRELLSGWAQEAVSPLRQPRQDSCLTSREREVLQLIAEGHTHREAADILHVSPRTVDTHANNIMQKLDIHDSARLTAYAVQAGIIYVPRR